MDCSKTNVFLAECRRMCDWHVNRMEQENCPLFSEYEGCTECLEGLLDNPEKVVELMQEWSDEHPQEIDWTKVPPNTPVLVWDNNKGFKTARYFAVYLPSAELKYKVFSYGDKLEDAKSLTVYKHCELAPEVDPTPYYKEG